MKNLGKTIDRLIKVDPELESNLLPIKNKWKRYPSKTTAYWQELLDFINSEPIKQHPKRDAFRTIITSRRTVPKQLYTFEEATKGDKIVGIIPEHLADMIRCHDRKAVSLAKKQVVANMTRNYSLMADISRLETLMEISTRKIWLGLKDHFQLWDKPIPFTIKQFENALYLIEQPQAKQVVGSGHMITPNGIVPMDPNTLRNFLRMIGGDLPPSPDGDGQ